MPTSGACSHAYPECPFRAWWRALRPRDAASVYAHPRAELARLTRTGALRRVATGYYVLSPLDRWGDDRWIPYVNAVARGIAQVDYGADVALMGLSAARHHGAIPRALAAAVAAVPKQRPALDTAAGRIVFVKRDVTRLDLERIDTQLTSGWVTTVEQTLIDLAARPTLGGLTEQDIAEAIRTLACRADWHLVRQLARDQHKPSAARTAARLAPDGPVALSVGAGPGCSTGSAVIRWDHSVPTSTQ